MTEQRTTPEPSTRTPHRRTRLARVAAVPLAGLLLLGVAGCGGATSTSDAAGAGSTTAAASEPAAAPGAPPGGGQAALVTGTGLHTVDGSSETSTGQAYATSTDDQSGVLVTGGGTLALVDATVTTSGASSSSDSSSFNGLNAGILVNGASTATISGGTVSTTGDGANGIFAYGEGASATITGTTIDATGQYAHGIMTSGGGTITATDVTATTAGANSGVIATDRGGGTITVSGGSYTASGQDSPGIYSTGAVTVSDATIAATGSESAVIEGANSITLTDTDLSSSQDGKWGVLIYQSMSGDASGSEGTFTMTGGSLASTAATGPLFYVTNATGSIALDGVDVSAASGVLLRASAGTWGTSGSNGGNAVLDSTGQQLTGDLVADAVSTVSISLASGSSLTGTINGDGTAKAATLVLDSSSTWVVTGDSTLTAITGATIDGGSVTNIQGNGHTVTYDAGDAANAVLDGGTYRLAGGGTLQPA
jgi:hypothetical protein